MVKGGALVTGATGGLGRVLVEQLLREDRPVIAIGRNRAIGHSLEAMGARFVAADLRRDPIDRWLAATRTVFHLAALSAPWGAEQHFVEANVTVTQRLLAAARSAGVERFVHVSTPAIYCRARDQFALREDSALPPSPANAYAKTKLMAERLVLAADDPAMRTVALRPRAIIAPHDAVLLPRLLKASERRAMPLPRGGRALIEPTDARDVVAALLAAEARIEAVGGRVFNISGGQPITVKALVSHVFERLDRPVRTFPVPALVALAAGTLVEAIATVRSPSREPVLTRYAALALGWSQTFDLSAARQALAWAPRHDPFSAIDWALSNRPKDAQHA